MLAAFMTHLLSYVLPSSPQTGRYLVLQFLQLPGLSYPTPATFKRHSLSNVIPSLPQTGSLSLEQAVVVVVHSPAYDNTAPAFFKRQSLPYVIPSFPQTGLYNAIHMRGVVAEKTKEASKALEIIFIVDWKPNTNPQ
jgi:hypothetical protein